MIKPVDGASGFLEFECAACHMIFRHAIRLYHDAASRDEEQEYDCAGLREVTRDFKLPVWMPGRERGQHHHLL